MNPQFEAKCTSCKKRWIMTEGQCDEARDMGCAFCHHCGSVATVERMVLLASEAREKQ